MRYRFKTLKNSNRNRCYTDNKNKILVLNLTLPIYWPVKSREFSGIDPLHSVTLDLTETISDL